MKEPRLPRKLNRACKVDDKDIEEIFAMRQMKLTYQQIADEYKITKQAIAYILKSPEEKKKVNKERHQRDTSIDKKRNNEASRKARLYKRKVLHKQMAETQRVNSFNYRRKLKEKLKENLYDIKN